MAFIDAEELKKRIEEKIENLGFSSGECTKLNAYNNVLDIIEDMERDEIRTSAEAVPALNCFLEMFEAFEDFDKASQDFIKGRKDGRK